MRLERHDLLTALRFGRSALPSHLSGSRTDRLAQAISLGEVVCDSESELSRSFVRAALHWQVIIEPRAISLIETTAIAVLPCDECIAMATSLRGEPVVLFSQGMLDLVASSLQMAEAIEALPIELSSSCPLAQFPGIAATNLTAVWLGSLLHRFSLHGGELPRLSHLIPEARRKPISQAISGAFLWLLLHELGHVALGHRIFGTEPGSTQLTASVIDETLNEDKLLEQEADAFASSCITAEGRDLVPLFVNVALGPAIYFEPLTSERSEDHPLASNRLASMLHDSVSLDGYEDLTGLSEHLRRHGAAFESIEETNATPATDGRRAPFAEWTKDGVIEGLKLLIPAYEACGVDLRGIFEPGPRRWKESVTPP